ncbi:MAG TPA: hypothetical protein DCX60_06265 [Phycisphaerales bacterium]|nr:hypothetical protein [Phycisphaerales bacterium]
MDIDTVPPEDTENPGNDRESEPATMTSAPPPESDTRLGPAASIRCIFGGVLMGLANLVPGISGGTMLLAAGIYALLVGAISDLAAFRVTRRSLVVLVLVVVPALLAIVLFSGVAGRFVLEQRWVAFSLFIGLTLGGVPVLMRSLPPVGFLTVVGCVAGLVAMAFLAFGMEDPGAPEGGGSITGLLVAGFAAGAAMLLPGLSGSYVLLVLGEYVVILTTIDEARAAVSARDWAALVAAGWTVLPVALGVVLGIGTVGVVVRWLLKHARALTMGFLLGLLVGAVFGLWPFRMPVPPQVGTIVRGDLIESVEQAEAVKAKYWPTVGFTPTASQIGGAAALILVGVMISGSIGLLGGRDADDPEEGVRG